MTEKTILRSQNINDHLLVMTEKTIPRSQNDHLVVITEKTIPRSQNINDHLLVMTEKTTLTSPVKFSQKTIPRLLHSVAEPSPF